MGDQPQAENQQLQEASTEELQVQELEKLEQSFTKVSSYRDPLKQEQTLIKEARDLSIPLDEYRRLYELSRKKSSTPKKILNGFWKWTGIGEKKMWDLLQLLLVPLFIFVATNSLQEDAKKREKKAAEDRARQETLNSYLDVMTKLLLEAKQKTTSVDEEPQLATIQVLAKTRTLTALRTLDCERSILLLKFLREAKLAKLIGERSSSKELKIDFKSANLRNADLKTADLSNIDLSTATLSGADLRGAKLIGANLSNADLTDAKLDGADFSKANLINAGLRNIDIRNIPAKFCAAKVEKGKESGQGCFTAYVNAASSLAVRNAPAGYILSALPYGMGVNLTGAQEYAAGRSWLQLSSGGWVASNYLSYLPTQSTKNISCPDLSND